MKVANCPACGYPLRVFKRFDTSFDWLMCRECLEPSFVALDEQENMKVLSLTDLHNKLPEEARKMLGLLASSGPRTISSIVFTSGKRAEEELPELRKMKVIFESEDKYFINPDLLSKVRSLSQ